MSSNYNEKYSAWQEEQKEKRDKRQVAAAETMKILKQRGVNVVQIDYSGSGDEGWVYECVTDKEGEYISKLERESLRDYVYELIPSGWEINEGSEGSVLFNIPTGLVEINHREAEIIYHTADIPPINLYET